MTNDYLETLGKYIRYKKEYVGNDTYRLYIKKNEMEFLEKSLQRLEAIDNANPSEVLSAFRSVELTLKENRLLNDGGWLIDDLHTIMEALQRLDKYEQILGSGRLTDRNYKNTTLDLDSCKPYVRLGQLEDIYEEGKKNG